MGIPMLLLSIMDISIMRALKVNIAIMDTPKIEDTILGVSIMAIPPLYGHTRCGHIHIAGCAHYGCV